MIHIINMVLLAAPITRYKTAFAAFFRNKAIALPASNFFLIRHIVYNLHYYLIQIYLIKIIIYIIIYMGSLEEWTDDEEEPEQMGEVPDTEPEPEEDDSDDDILEKSTHDPEEDESDKENDPPVSEKTGRPKKKLSQKQLDALAKGRATRDTGRAIRKTKKQEDADIKKKKKEEAIVKKAVRIKKKELMEEAALEISSEEEDDELEIKQVKRALAKRRATKKKTAKQQVASPEPEAPAQQFVFY
tara:strand:+ start:1425 stop:2156 length:732 start_codon:yes stop_codon:yes gene_type:complete